MAIAFVNLTTHKRSLGHSVAAALAYRAGLALRDVRTGELHDYRPRETREEIADFAIVSSRPTPLATDWQTLADAMESREKHPRAWILRDVKVGIPHELPLDQKKQLAHRISEALAQYGDTVVPYALHPPSASGDYRNWHTHHAMATRSLTEDGTAFGKKLSKLDSKYRSPEEIAYLRNMIGDLVNEALREAGIDEEVHMGRRLDEDASPSIPGEIVQMARRRTEQRLRRTEQRLRRTETRHRRSDQRTRRIEQQRGRTVQNQRGRTAQQRRRTDQRRTNEPRHRRISQRIRRTEQQRRSLNGMAARELVDLAVANGDVESLHSRGGHGDRRSLARSGDRPRYRRRSRSWRQRRAEEKQQDVHQTPAEAASLPVAPIIPESEAAPAASSLAVVETQPGPVPSPTRKRRRRTKQAKTLDRAEQQSEALPSPVRKHRRRSRQARSLDSAAVQTDLAPSPRPARKRRRRAPRIKQEAQQMMATPIPVQPPHGSDLKDFLRVDPQPQTTALDELFAEIDTMVMPASENEREARPGVETHVPSAGITEKPIDVSQTAETSTPREHDEASTAEEPHEQLLLRKAVAAGAEEYGVDLIREHAGEATARPSLAGIPPGGRQDRKTRDAILPHVRPFFVAQRNRVDQAVTKWRRHFRVHRNSIIDSLMFAIAPLAWLRAQGVAAMRDWRATPPDTPSGVNPIVWTVEGCRHRH